MILLCCCYQINVATRDALSTQVSPAKFAWLVHSTGVALASLSPISSWVGLQIGYTKAVLGTLGVSPPLDGFLVVLRSLPFRFFPLFYLLLILIVLVSNRDFGNMADSESAGAGTAASESQSTAADDSEGGGGGGGGIRPKAGTPLRSINAVFPFGAVIVVTSAGMILDGIGKIEADGNQARHLRVVFVGCWHPGFMPSESANAMIDGRQLMPLGRVGFARIGGSGKYRRLIGW